MRIGVEGQARITVTATVQGTPPSKGRWLDKWWSNQMMAVMEALVDTVMASMVDTMMEMLQIWT